MRGATSPSIRLARRHGRTSRFVTLKWPALRLSGLLLGTILTAHAPAQTDAPWPARRVRVIVPYAPSGSVDVATRLVARKFSEALGQPFTIVNLTGDGGIIGLNHAAEAAADGYTLVASGPNIALATLLAHTARFDPNTSFSHVGRFASDAALLGVPAESPFNSIEALLAAARAQPDTLSFASPGKGSPGHLAMELLQRRAGVSLRHIPYRGGAPAITDLIGNRVTMVLVGASLQLPHVQAGRIRPLAVTAPRRLAELPGTPSLAESYPGYECVVWFGIAAPAGLPGSVVQRLGAELERQVAVADFIQRMQAAGLTVDFMGPGDLTRYVARETSAFSQLIKSARIAAD